MYDITKVTGKLEKAYTSISSATYELADRSAPSSSPSSTPSTPPFSALAVPSLEGRPSYLTSPLALPSCRETASILRPDFEGRAKVRDWLARLAKNGCFRRAHGAASNPVSSSSGFSQRVKKRCTFLQTSLSGQCQPKLGSS